MPENKSKSFCFRPGGSCSGLSMSDLARLQEQPSTWQSQKLKWKQRCLRALSLTHLVFLTLSEGGPFCNGSELGSFSYSSKNSPHPQTHSDTRSYAVLLPLVLTYPWQRNARLFLKTPLANSLYWLIHHQDWFGTFQRKGHLSSILTLWTVGRMIRAS